ncbi:FAD-binding protein (plasmid) [Paracoccus kondratievae]|uniref:FAD-dependent oxidoreductase n=1 Tax=Paracoccus kondratievae TaxID=135740 RepID=UPI0012664E5F|nr:FAD-dependent oxidoreductase [Paracoccus kondratievae]QFQ89825.1 FAD-binding protein [Paracoccus kondratievae]
MANEYAADVLICGAGAAGLTLAIDLARRGVSFRLIDKLAQPFPGSRGKGIQPRTQEIFEDLGVLDRLVAAGGIYPPIRDHRPDGSFAEISPVELQGPTPAEPYHLALMVPQFLTEAVLRQRLAELGRHAEFGCKLIALRQDADGVTADLISAKSDETARFRYLVGTDGGRSFVRQALDIAFPGRTLGARAMVADVALTGLDRTAWHRFNGDDKERMLMACPLAGTDLFQIQAPIPAEGGADLSAEGIERMFLDRTGRADIRITAVNWASAYAMNARLAEHYRVGRVFLAGDAAHIHPPTGGQGLNTSVQDAYNLGWKLAAVLGGADDTLLDSYEAERRPVAEGMLGLATRLLRESQSGGMRRGREVQQLDIGYPDSALIPDLPPRKGTLRPGERAPDAPVMGAAGQPSRLFHWFRGPHWTLLVHGATGVAPTPRAGLHIHHIGPQGDLIDHDGHVRAAYGLAQGEAALIRPDGYIAAILPAVSEATAQLETFLNRMGLTPCRG